MTYRLAHLIHMPAKRFLPGADVAATIEEAKKKGPLIGGPVSVVRVAPFDLKHPLHSARAAFQVGVRQS